MFGLIQKLLPFVLIVGVVLFLLSGTTWASKPVELFSAKKLVQCDVTVNNLLLKAPKIAAVSCVATNACAMTIAAPSLKFIVPTDTVFARLTTSSGEQSAVEKYIVTEQLVSDTSLSRTLKVCTADTAGSITLRNEKGDIIDSQSWKVS